MKVITDNSVEKATMIMENSMGITTMWHIWLNEHYYEKKGYQNKVVVIFKMKGTRKLKGSSFPADNKIAIVKGWQTSNILTNKIKNNSFMAPEMISFDDTFDKVVNEMNDITFINK